MRPILILLAVAILGLATIASAGWFERQLAEWHEMSSCAATTPGERPTGARGVEHRWSWRLGWPPGRWTCVFTDRRARVVGTRIVP